MAPVNPAPLFFFAQLIIGELQGKNSVQSLMKAKDQMCLFLALFGSCSHSSQWTEAQVLTAAEPAMNAKFPDNFEAYRPYRAEKKDGTWWVHGSMPTNTVGGTAEALVEHGTGKVLKVWHTQ